MKYGLRHFLFSPCCSTISELDSTNKNVSYTAQMLHLEMILSRIHATRLFRPNYPDPSFHTRTFTIELSRYLQSLSNKPSLIKYSKSLIHTHPMAGLSRGHIIGLSVVGGLTVIMWITVYFMCIRPADKKAKEMRRRREMGENIELGGDAGGCGGGGCSTD